MITKDKGGELAYRIAINRLPLNCTRTYMIRIPTPTTTSDREK